jgi:RimJ/RimL family protein N-acetyltransferase
VNWLSSNEWPFHGQTRLTRTDVLNRISTGRYDPPNSEVYWITDGTGDALGLLHLFDLNDIDTGSPDFDLRVRIDVRKQGIGVRAVNWLNSELFTRYPQLHRIAATTRADNRAMRAVFEKCGYAKEGHFRQAWPVCGGNRLDSVEYGILRSDWETSTVTPVNWTDNII